MDLIKIHNNKGQSVVSARELHLFLESRQDFSTWIKSRIEKYEFIPEQDFVRFHKKMEGNNAVRIEYALTMDMAKELSMVENNEKGKTARRYFIEKEKQLKKLTALPDFNNPVIAARAWADEVEKKLIAEKKAISLQSKADLADKVINSEGLVDIGQVSKLLKLPYGRNTLFKKLRGSGVFFKGRNEPKQQYVNSRYFEVKIIRIQRPEKKDLVKLKVYATQRGLDFINKRLFGRQHEQLALID